MSSAPSSSHNHLAQLLWTGFVALVLGVVALQQTSEPSASVVSTLNNSTPETLLTGSPMLLDPLRDLRSPAGLSEDKRFTPALPGRNVPAQ